MKFWGLVDYLIEEVIEVFASREGAEEELRQILGDEPDWREILDVVPVSIAFCPN